MRIADYQTKTKRREKKISFKHDQDLAAIKRPEILKPEEEQRVRKELEETTCSIRNHDRPRRSRRTGANPTEIRVLSMGKSLKIEPFRIPEQPLEFGWAWIEDFEDEISYFEITEIRDCVSALKIYGGKEIKKPMQR